MDASSLITFLLVAVFWLITAALRGEKKKGVHRQTVQKTVSDAPEHPAVSPQHPQRAKTYRAATPGSLVRPSAEGTRNPVGFGSFKGESTIGRKGYSAGSGGLSEGVSYDWGGEGTSIGSEGYTPFDGGLTEGTSQWTNNPQRYAAPLQPSAQKRTEKPAPSLRQLIPLNGEELLRGVVFSEILSRKTVRKR